MQRITHAFVVGQVLAVNAKQTAIGHQYLRRVAVPVHPNTISKMAPISAMQMQSRMTPAKASENDSGSRGASCQCFRSRFQILPVMERPPLEEVAGSQIDAYGHWTHKP